MPTPSPRLDPDFQDAEALAFVLDRLPVGIFLADRTGRVLWMNGRARSRIASGCELELRQGRIAARSHAVTLALRRVLERVVTATDEGAEPETFAPSPSEVPGSALVLVVRRIERRDAHARPGSAEVVIFLSEADLQLRASRKRLRRLFGFTPAECELTALLAAGHSLRAAAQQLEITHESARTYLKRALQKTGTRRQAELVRLALSVATAGADEA